MNLFLFRILSTVVFTTNLATARLQAAELLVEAEGFGEFKATNKESYGMSKQKTLAGNPARDLGPESHAPVESEDDGGCRVALHVRHVEG